MLLSLPTLAPQIPRRFVHGGGNPEHFAFAMAMSQCGFIDAEWLNSLPADKPIPLAQFQDLLRRGWDKATDSLFSYQHLGLDARFELNPERVYNYQYGEETEELHPRIYIGIRHWPEVTIGATMTHLDAAMPGLGAKVMDFLDFALTVFTGPSFTPAGAYQMAQHLYWDGEEDHTHLLEHVEGQGFDIPTVDDLFKGIPKWGYNPHASLARRISLKNRARRLKGTRFESLISALVALETTQDRLFPGGRSRPPKGQLVTTLLPDMECVNPVAAMFWHPDYDPIFRVFDDHYTWQSECGSDVDCIAFSFPLTAQGLKECLAEIQIFHDHLAAIDRVVDALMVLEADPELQPPKPLVKLPF